MRKLLSIFLLAAFLFQSTNKLWIMVSFYVQQDYIAKNICVNRFDLIPICAGQCFLTNQLKKSDKQEQNIPDIKLKDTHLFFMIAFNFTLNFAETSISARTLDFQPKRHLNTSIGSVFHPPRPIPTDIV